MKVFTSTRRKFYAMIATAFVAVAVVVTAVYVVNTIALPNSDSDISRVALSGKESWFVLQYENGFAYKEELWRPDGTKLLTAEHISAVYPAENITFVRATNESDAFGPVGTTWYEVKDNSLSIIDVPTTYENVVQYSPNMQFLLAAGYTSTTPGNIGKDGSEIHIKNVATGKWDIFSNDLLPEPYADIMKDGTFSRATVGWHDNKVVIAFTDEEYTSPKTIAQFLYDPITETLTEIPAEPTLDLPYYQPEPIAYPLFKNKSLAEYQPRYTLAMPLIGVHGIVDREATVNTKSKLAPTFQIGRGLFHGGVYLGGDIFLLQYNNTMTIYNAALNVHAKLTELTAQDYYVFANMYPLELAR